MSRAKQVLGKDLMLFVNGKAIALATSCKIGVSSETIDTQSKDSGMWNEKDIKKIGWNCSSENCLSADGNINGYDALFALMVAGQPVKIAFGITSNKGNEYPGRGWQPPQSPYFGDALITSLELNAPDGDKATFSVSLDGTGELKKGNLSLNEPYITEPTSSEGLVTFRRSSAPAVGLYPIDYREIGVIHNPGIYDADISSVTFFLIGVETPRLSARVKSDGEILIDSITEVESAKGSTEFDCIRFTHSDDYGHVEYEYLVVAG